MKWFCLLQWGSPWAWEQLWRNNRNPQRRGGWEKVHGGVQFGVNFDDYNHPKIPHHSDTVDGEEYQEEGHSQLWVIGEAQESEHSPTFISLW